MASPVALSSQLRTIEYKTSGLAVRLDMLSRRVKQLIDTLHGSDDPTEASTKRMLVTTAECIGLGRDDLDQISRSLAALEKQALQTGPLPR